ncbi:hypothetical protein BCR32DRAFT_289469 [Anaeromyces robustus]|uniref:Uncharacterized protein n=1 Tax=Anaeromyces robustus TaxID=1754192 RepID=A0A1Y1XPG4_9FUNG|nr:hypothetical protein BCR32DRAFT_289469 [Anaeromyces robustus]|eukprot:ORX87214.1 hypothetical protein BCR32DRAFT_289469 [Anaeromyces robustus]
MATTYINPDTVPLDAEIISEKYLTENQISISLEKFMNRDSSRDVKEDVLYQIEEFRNELKARIEEKKEEKEKKNEKNIPLKNLFLFHQWKIYNEIPNSTGGENLSEIFMLRPHLEASNLDYTIILSGWFDEGSNDYEVTEKGHDVSRQAICNLVLKLIQENNYGIRKSLGINRLQ